MAGYCQWAAWDEVITLAIASVCEIVRLAMGDVFGVVFAFGGGWSTLWGNLGLVRHTTASY